MTGRASRCGLLALALVVTLAGAPAAAKQHITMAPSGSTTWPELLRRDRAVIEALGGRRRAVPYFRTGPPRALGPALREPVVAPLVEAPSATAPTSPVGFLALADDDTVIPPDTMGAAGPGHLMTMLNSQVRIQNKSGGAISTVSLTTFWTAGTGLTGDPFDPRLIFDALSGRWIATVGADGNSNSSAVWFAISATSDPTGAWTFFRLPSGSFRGRHVWADFPTTGLNATWIAIAANMFTVSPSNSTFQGDKMWVIDKATAVAGGPLTVTVFPTHFDLAANVDGYALQPALTFDAAQPALYIVDNSGWTNNGVFLLRLSQITGSGPSPAWAPAAGGPLPGTGLFSVANNFSSSQIRAAQLGAAGLVDSGDPRIQNAVFRNGRIWCTHSGGLPVAGVDRTAVFWYQLDPTLMPATGAPIAQSGVLDGGPGVHHFYPSIAANQNDDAVIGCSRSDATRFVEAVYTGRAGSDAAGTTAPIAVLKAGEASYEKVFSSGVIRWGDYSATVVDPVDGLSFWTLQEYAAQDVGPTADDDRWGTWWGKVQVGPIAPSPTPTVTRTPVSTPTITATVTRTATRTATATASGTVTSTPTSVPTALPPLTLDPIAAPIVVGAFNDLTGSGFTVGSVVVLFVAIGSGAQQFGPYTPSSWTSDSLQWLAPVQIPLGDGFASVQIVNTDQGYIGSNPQGQLLVGAAAAGFPTITALNGVPLNPPDPSVPLANVATAIAQDSVLTITGSGFSNPVVALYSSNPTAAALEPVAPPTGTQMQVHVPADIPTGPGSLQVLNRPSFTPSNLVSAPIGERIRLDSVSQSGATITANGAGFSVRTIISFFNAQPGGVVNLGGLVNGTQSLIPFTLVSPHQLRFAIPPAAVSGAAYVQLLNPPFIPFTSTGNSPNGAIAISVP